MASQDGWSSMEDPRQGARRLVDLRAAANGTTFEQEWSTIFDLARLLAEIDGPDPARDAAAADVLDQLSDLAGLRAARSNV